LIILFGTIPKEFIVLLKINYLLYNLW